MSVNFYLLTVCKQLPNVYRQHNRLISNLEVKQPTIKEINSLHFLLNIDRFFPNVEIETILPGRQNSILIREFAPLHLVAKKLSKLQNFYPRICTSSSPSRLDWIFLERSTKLRQTLYCGRIFIGSFSFCLLSLCFR